MLKNTQYHRFESFFKKSVYILNMASRKIPTFFYNRKGLIVSADIEDNKFYISPGLIIVNGKFTFFKGGSGDLLDPPCLIGFKVNGTFSTTKKQTVEIVDNCIGDQEPLEQKCEEREATFISKPEFELEPFCEPMVEGEVGDYYFKSLGIFFGETFIQYTDQILRFQAKLFKNEKEQIECSDGLLGFLV